METTNTQNSGNSDERKLCVKCEMFYGTNATNFMCSKCFKEDQESKAKSDPKETSNSTAHNNQSSDANMTGNDSNNNQEPEENKGPSRPIQVSFIPNLPHAHPYVIGK